MRRLLGVIALGWLVGVLSAAPASAAGLAPPVADCYAHTRLTHNYTVSELRTGLSTMPAYIKEYSDCSNVLQQALLAKIGRLNGVGSSSSGGGSFLPTWLIIVLAVLVVGGVAYGAVALRNRGDGP